MKCLPILTVLMISATQASQGPTPPILDLTNEGKPSIGPITGGELVGGPVGGLPQRLPVQATLLSIDRKEVGMGNTIVYEVQLENKRAKDLLFPWVSSADWVERTTSAHPNPMGQHEASICLSFSLENGHTSPFACRGVQGADSMPGSMRRLTPGEKVILTASGVLLLGSEGDSTELQKLLPGKFQVRTSLGFFAGSPTPGAVIEFSENTLEIQMNPRKAKE